MVDELKGSETLRKQMPFGAIKKIAKTFGHTSAWVARVIAGTKKGDPSIIECAIKVSELQSEVEEKLTEILKDYGDINS